MTTNPRPEIDDRVTRALLFQTARNQRIAYRAAKARGDQRAMTIIASFHTMTMTRIRNRDHA